MRQLLSFLIKGYQVVMPSLKGIFGVQGECRYLPSCSNFTREMILERGVLEGLYLGMKRLLSCHPLHRANHG